MYYTLTIQRGGIFTAGEGRHIKISKGLNSAKRTHNKRRQPPFGHHRCRHSFPFCLYNILCALGGIELTTPRLARRSVYRWTTANTKATFANTGHPGSPLFLPVTWPPLEIASSERRPPIVRCLPSLPLLHTRGHAPSARRVGDTAPCPGNSNACVSRVSAAQRPLHCEREH